MKTKILGDYQICISVHLITFPKENKRKKFNRDVFFAFFNKFLINLRRQFRARKIFSRREFRTQVFAGFTVF